MKRTKEYRLLKYKIIAKLLWCEPVSSYFIHFTSAMLKVQIASVTTKCGMLRFGCKKDSKLCFCAVMY